MVIPSSFVFFNAVGVDYDDDGDGDDDDDDDDIDENKLITQDCYF